MAEPTAPTQSNWARPGLLAGVGVAVALAVTAAVSATGLVPTVVPTPGIRTLAETAIGLSALLASCTFLQRWAADRMPVDAMVGLGLAVLAVAGLLSAVLQDLTAAAVAGLSWSVVLLRAVGSGLVVAGLTGRFGHQLRRAGIVLAVVVALGLVVPLVMQPASPPSAPLLAKAVLVPAFLSAGFLAVRRAQGGRDELFWWVAAWFLLLALAQTSLSVQPTIDPALLHLADLLRAAGYVVLAIGCVWFLGTQPQLRQRAAVAAERQRVARALHDGLAQELAFLQAQSRWLVQRAADPAGLDLLAGAAENAMEEARLTMAALDRPLDEALATTLEREADSLARRLGCQVRLHLQDISVSDAERDALVRQLRSDMRRAGEDGTAGEVHIRLVDGEEPRLEISVTQASELNWGQPQP